MKKLLAVFTMVMALFIVNFTTNAEAIVVKLPSGPCPAGSNPCVGGYTLNDMGYFDGDTWVWDEQFLETMNHSNFDVIPTTAALESLGPNWLNIITPVKVSAPPRITSGRLDRRYYAPGKDPAMRLVFQASGEGQLISYVPLYLRECFKTVSDIQIHELSTPCYSDPDVQRVNIFAENATGNVVNPPTPRYATAPLNAGIALTINDIESVRWVEKNLIGTPSITDIQIYQSVSYDLTKRFWNPLGNWTNSTDLHFAWNPIPDDLAADEVATFEVTLKNTSTVMPPLPAPVLRAKTIIRSLEALPTIPATITGTEYNILKEKEKKSGKIVIKAEEVEVTRNNITVREIDDPSDGKALVIQWPEPDIALFGGVDFSQYTEYQVKVWVGAIGPGTFSNGWFTPASIYGTTDVFLIYDIPAQMGTCVVEGPSYETLLAKMQEKGFSPSDLRVMVFYRANYNNFSFSQVPVTFKLTFQNRGMSPYVSINEN